MLDHCSLAMRAGDDLEACASFRAAIEASRSTDNELYELFYASDKAGIRLLHQALTSHACWETLSVMLAPFSKAMKSQDPQSSNRFDSVYGLTKPFYDRLEREIVSVQNFAKDAEGAMIAAHHLVSLWEINLLMSRYDADKSMLLLTCLLDSMSAMQEVGNLQLQGILKQTIRTDKTLLVPGPHERFRRSLLQIEEETAQEG